MDHDCPHSFALPSESLLSHRLAAARQARRYLVEKMRFPANDPLLVWVEEDISSYEQEMSAQRTARRLQTA